MPIRVLRSGFALVVSLSCALPPAQGPAPSAAPDAVLRFLRDGVLVRSLSLAELREACGAERVEISDDPYYAGDRRFHAVPFGCVLERGFSGELSSFVGEDFFLRARDGYTRPAPGAQLGRCCAFLAYSDADRVADPELAARTPAWDPIDRRAVDPSPFYLVWTGPEQNDAHLYPWPYQLAEVEIAPFESHYPKTEPIGVAADSAARRGFEIFARECIACHSMNGEGGKVGPELNIPRSIIEYRPAQQIRAFVREPASFRYTSMPPHSHLDDTDLDGLIEYFRAMSRRKCDPDC